MSEPTVSAAYARALFDLAVEKGADRNMLTARTGVRPRDFDDPHRRIAFDTFKMLMREGQSLCGEPALALYFGAQIAFDQLSLVGLISRAAPTMEDAFREMNRYGRLIIEVEGIGAEDRFQIVRRDGRTWIDDIRMYPNSFPELTESTLGRFICGVNRYFPDRHYYRSAQVTHARPEYAPLYDELLGIPVEFGCTHNAMEIDPSLLELKLNPKKNYVFGMLSEQAAKLLAELETMKTLRAEIERHLMPILHTGTLGLEDVSSEMGMSRQQLYRALRAEGVRFKEIVDDLRHRLALEYLKGGKVSINETAYLVGFSDPSAFSRAFKRWTGESPGQFAATAG
ncbi:AraC family transcriptional regulator [Parasphingopyxis lamellibrachiae]|uniref:AraC family transcriptional regulator n=1 Tax=Parasphingopyxis lamellibrachiae TaxID=680125 RepID=A0A3D9FH17_9SPHN|nr:AraC family transcriptional regulator [Parasphingopyxis lamellibrachiae]RED16948.1 AraC family transcriptional regulator [Parasphingopyxis lamellibrachiae]